MELKKLKRIGIIILILLLLLFIFTNIRVVEITLFFWHVEMPLAMLILLTVLIGFLLGLIAALSFGWKKDKNGKSSKDDKTSANGKNNPEGRQSGPGSDKST